MDQASHDFVVFSDDWGRHPSSCQHLFAQLVRRHRVLWVNTVGLRGPRVDRFTLLRGLEKLAQWTRPLRQVGAGFWVYSPWMLPAAGGRGGELNSRFVAQCLRRVIARCGLHRPILFASVPTAGDYAGALDERAVVYYITDDYRRWPGADAARVAEQDRRLKAAADLLLPASRALAEDLPAGARVELLAHAVDLDHFADAGHAGEPADLASIPHPRLCFCGLIYEKVDLALLERVARTDPRRRLVLIGPVKTDVSRLAALPNVHLLGAKPYAQVPWYLHHVDVLLLAYVLDEQILRSAPLKIRECLAVGKPTVARAVPDLEAYRGLVHLAGDDEAFLGACDRACAERPDVDAMRAAVTGQTWAARAVQLEAALSALPGVGRALPARRAAPTADAAAWDAYVAAHPEGSVWHRFAWTRAMRGAYAMRCWNLTALRDGRVVGVLPVALQSSPFFGRHLVSLPWLDHAGVLADDEPASAALLGAATGLARRLRADLTLRQRAPLAGPGGRVRNDKVAMVLDLSADADALWRGFCAKVRNQVRKADKSGLVAEWAGPEALGEFVQVYSTNMRDLGSPPHSREFFSRVLEHLGDLARLVVVRLGRQAVASALVLTDERCWQVPWASSLRAFNALCPNHLLYWTILSAACGRTRQFCFGRSTVGSGTFNFKAQWGARAIELHWQTWPARPRPADAEQPGRLVRTAQRLWQKLPVPLAQALGPQLIRTVG